MGNDHILSLRTGDALVQCGAQALGRRIYNQIDATDAADDAVQHQAANEACAIAGAAAGAAAGADDAWRTSGP